ncbi:hypothetical protein IY145_16350 [Methylosinus sp. H3A]|uniref:hypothetical protein n=1 Tax=Methylosinus sp. H3A TaxID=2785786 RepID=UPI0018C23383|nr:hypothetical protein [Methylosinus sp. H3A]MBG0810942.1 hypothetical protein [Methylosinus sp. H3A]
MKRSALVLVVAPLLCTSAIAKEPEYETAPAAVAGACPPPGWQENLGNFQKPNAAFPTQDTASVPTPDCNFHEWSFEAYVWATALDANGTPRFLTLPTPDDLLSTNAKAAEIGPRTLKLAARSLMPHGTAGYTEGAGAIVEADGNVLVGPNGYPILASVHMNQSYFATAKKNLIVTNGYATQPQNSSFETGAAVFKATWLRLAPGQKPPAGAYVTEAEVPVLTVLRTKTSIAILPVAGQFVKAQVALVGLHVVGSTVNHPEFLWATFEHKLNAPAVADNTFAPSPTAKNPNAFTFYAANTPFSTVNSANVPPALTFDLRSQRFAPVNNVVLENRTGGENQTGGQANVLSVNASGQTFLAGEPNPQSIFANYNLGGTVWMAPNSYNLNSDQTNAVGSVNLANTTAETFFQQARNQPMSNVQNCFTCHNPTSYSFQQSPPPLANRLIALSHVLAYGSPYAVPNLITGRVTSNLR